MITRSQILNTFDNLIRENPYEYLDCGEINSTRLAEDAQSELNVCTELGTSPIELEIFDLAVDYAIKWEK